MSQIEDLVYSAHEHGRRTQLLDEVAEVRKKNPRMDLTEVYNIAYSSVMNTQIDEKQYNKTYYMVTTRYYISINGILCYTTQYLHTNGYGSIIDGIGSIYKN